MLRKAQAYALLKSRGHKLPTLEELRARATVYHDILRLCRVAPPGRRGRRPPVRLLPLRRTADWRHRPLLTIEHPIVHRSQSGAKPVTQQTALAGLARALQLNQAGRKPHAQDRAETEESTPLFNPRQQAWTEHFAWSTSIGTTGRGLLTAIPGCDHRRTGLAIERDGIACPGPSSQPPAGWPSGHGFRAARRCSAASSGLRDRYHGASNCLRNSGSSGLRSRYRSKFVFAMSSYSSRRHRYGRAGDLPMANGRTCEAHNVTTPIVSPSSRDELDLIAGPIAMNSAPRSQLPRLNPCSGRSAVRITLSVLAIIVNLLPAGKGRCRRELGPGCHLAPSISRLPSTQGPGRIQSASPLRGASQSPECPKSRVMMAETHTPNENRELSRRLSGLRPTRTGAAHVPIIVEVGTAPHHTPSAAFRTLWIVSGRAACSIRRHTSRPPTPTHCQPCQPRRTGCRLPASKRPPVSCRRIPRLGPVALRSRQTSSPHGYFRFRPLFPCLLVSLSTPSQLAAFSHSASVSNRIPAHAA